MNKPPYGMKRKKVIFYDTDKRYADLKIRLAYDELSQAHFFRSIVSGYLEKDPDMLNFIDKVKLRKGAQKKSDVKRTRKLIKVGKEKAANLNLDEEEKQSIFDILEKENPDI
jgi:hypothetical protein